MPATVRYDQQYCPIARALDELGDRWTLLIIRELVIGDQRFTDLREHLPGIAPTLLTQRLRTMTEHGLVVSKQLPPPAARSVYAITDRGRSAIPVMRELAKWGMPLLEEPLDDQVLRPWAAVNPTVGAYYDAAAAAGIDERYVFRIGGEDITLSSVRGPVVPRDPPDVVLESEARLWLDIRQGRITFDEAIERGLLHTHGTEKSLENMRRIFRLG